jgi:hypothetical protein
MENKIKYKDFFFNNNKSGWKTIEKKLSNSNPEICCLILNYCDTDILMGLPFKQKVWHFINNINFLPKCSECYTELKFKKSLSDGYGKYCSIICTNKNKDHIDNVKITNNKVYGGNSPFNSEEIKEKYKNTMLKKYGVDNIFKNLKYISDKTFDKYGVNHISKLDNTKVKISNTNKERYSVTTPIILKENRVKNNESKLINFGIKYSELNIIKNYGDNVTIVCDVCDNEYEINRPLLSYRFCNSINPCTICNPINDLKSIKEKELSDFIKSLNIDIIEGDRKILNKLELDIYIPSHKLAFEFDGLYWHSELYRDKNYHLNKTIECEKQGIQLIHIFEDEWINKKDIVKSRIKNLLGLTGERIFARKCIIKEVKIKEKTKFLNDNHIQGAVGSKINLGLYYNNELVSLMTFGKSRIIMNGDNTKYELFRFCNKLDTTIIGGASKLLKHFIKTHQPKELISYADRRWSIGNLYKELGFDLTHNSAPNYYYILNNTRKYRFGFRKDILVKEGYDSNLTEHEIMLDRRIYRIYDCGNIVFSKKII